MSNPRQKEIEIPSQAQYIPYLKISPNYICGFYKYEGPKRKTWQQHVFTGKNLDNLIGTKEQQKKVYTGEITEGSKRRMKKVCELLFAIARKKEVKSPKTGKPFKFKIGLITLTLSAPQGELTDRDIKDQLLAPFLRHFRNKGLRNYIWKSERQWNGNVHFHILTDAFIDLTEIQNYWNKLQSKFGFIEHFYGKYGHRNPNSTDVKSVHTESGMVSYMFKYMLKGEDEEKKLALQDKIPQDSIGKIWDCSLNLKLKNDTADVVEDWQFEALEKKLDADFLVEITSDFCRIYFPKGSPMWKASPAFLHKRLQDYLRKVKEFERPPASQASPKKSSPVPSVARF